MTALQRRVPHIPVLMAPALVQGAGAAATLVQALQHMYDLTAEDNPLTPPVDVILLVRGGGAMEDLWAFNDERVVRAVAAFAMSERLFAEISAPITDAKPTNVIDVTPSVIELFVHTNALSALAVPPCTKIAAETSSDPVSASVARVGAPDAATT